MRLLSTVFALLAIAPIASADDHSDRELLAMIASEQAANIDRIESLALSCVSKIDQLSTESHRTVRQLLLWQPRRSRFLATDARAGAEKSVFGNQPLTPGLLFGGPNVPRSTQNRIWEMFQKFSESKMYRPSVLPVEGASDEYRITNTVVESADRIGQSKTFDEWHVSKKNCYYPHYYAHRFGVTFEESKVEAEGRFLYDARSGITFPKMIDIKSFREDLDGKVKCVLRFRTVVIKASLNELLDDTPIGNAEELSEEILFNSASLQKSPDVTIP